jgi:hypothetical protein
VFTYVLSSLINVGTLLHMLPFKDSHFQRLEIINELLVLTTCTMCLWFTGFVTNRSDILFYDHILKYTVLLQIAFNFASIAIDTVSDLKEMARQKYVRVARAVAKKLSKAKTLEK